MQQPHLTIDLLHVPEVQALLADAQQRGDQLQAQLDHGRARRSHLRRRVLDELRHNHVAAAVALLDDEAWDA